MSPKRSVVGPIPATAVRYSNHHKRRLSNIPVLAGIIRPKLQQPHSRVRVLKASLALIQSIEQNQTIPGEAVGDLGMRSYQGQSAQMEARRSPKRITEHEDSQGAATSSRRRVMSTNFFSHEFAVPLHCASREWIMHENQSHGFLQPLGLEVVPLDGELRVSILHHGRQGCSRFSFSYHQFRTDFLRACQIAQLCTKVDVLAQHRSIHEREAPQRMQVAGAVADQCVQRSRLFGSALSNA